MGGLVIGNCILYLLLVTFAFGCITNFSMLQSTQLWAYFLVYLVWFLYFLLMFLFILAIKTNLTTFFIL